MSMPVVDGAVRNLKKVQDHITKGMDDIIGVATHFAETEGNLENVQELEAVLLKYATMERTLTQFQHAVNQVKSQVNNAEGDLPNVKEMLKSSLREQAKENTEEDIQGHSKVVELRSRLEELQGDMSTLDEDEDMDTAASIDQSLGEEDLVMTQSELGTKCPITQQEMTNPVRNTLCGHHYDKRGVDELLRRKRETRCPYTGCTEVIRQQNVELDPEFRRQIQKAKRSQKRKPAADSGTL